MIVFVLLSSIATIIIAILEYFSKKTNNSKIALGLSFSVVILVIIIQAVNVKYASSQNKEANTLLDSVKSANVIIGTIRASQDSISRDLKISNTKLYEIEDALKDKGFMYDSSTKTLIHVNKIQFDMPNANIKGGNNQFGNGNTQYNKSK